jgi:hypothetical protein
MEAPGPASGLITVELQIDQVSAADAAEATVIVRCLRHPVRLGARFHRIRDAAEPIDLELTQIVFYGRAVEELEPVHTALVSLRGTGALHLLPGTSASGWQVIQGTNPPR